MSEEQDLTEQELEEMQRNQREMWEKMPPNSIRGHNCIGAFQSIVEGCQGR